MKNEDHAPLTYGSYLRLDELLALQQPRSDPPEHDEMLFIVIHQVYELWFKLLLHELDAVKEKFVAGDVFGSIHTFKRVRTVMKTLVGQLDILETMTPVSFASFRDRLEQASGFQSVQFREIEFLLGAKRAELLQEYDPSWPGYERLRQRLREPSVVDCFYDFLERQGAKVPEELRRREASLPAVPNEALQEEILRLYLSRGELLILFELMTDFDEGMQEWRYRHVKLVERTIGNKRGTGGTLGVEFLKTTLFRPFFADLWAIRHRL
jgi:tryptophan 2,3-dioxygenase